MRHDQVKVGESIWTEAQKIPEFSMMFEDFELENKIPDGVDLQNIFTNFQLSGISKIQHQEIQTFNNKTCAIHQENLPYYVCSVCKTLFCKDCFASNDSKNLKICPYCGGICDLRMEKQWQFNKKQADTKYELEEEKKVAPVEEDYEIVYTKLTLKDFISATLYPFRFPIGFFVGCCLYALLVMGQITSLFQGGWMLAIAAAIGSVGLMINFGVMFKMFENFTQPGQENRSFMPRIQKFTFFEDLVNPFIIGFKAYLTSFAIFLLIIVIAGTSAWFIYSGEVQNMEGKMSEAGNRVNLVLDSRNADPNKFKAKQDELDKIINKTKLRQLETTFGTNHLAENSGLLILLYSIMRLTLWFQMPICFAFIFGVLFFPAVCLSTSENHYESFAKRYISSFKMIKRIGFDYVKIVFFCGILLMTSFISVYLLNYIFSKIEMPVAGILTAIVTASFLFFYFWLVYSYILSITLSNKELILKKAS